MVHTWEKNAAAAAILFPQQGCGWMDPLLTPSSLLRAEQNLGLFQFIS